MDSAVSAFGTHVEAALEGVKGRTDKARQTQRDAVLRQYIPELAKARKFADPGKR